MTNQAVVPTLIQSKVINLPKLTTPLDYFSLIAAQPWAIWLDSCFEHQAIKHIDSQLDIMVWQPTLTLTTVDNNTTIIDQRFTKQDQQYRQTSNDDPLTLLAQAQQQVFSADSIDAANFGHLIGAFGYFAYDLGRRFEQLPKQAAHDINTPDMAIGIYRHALVFDHQSQQMYLICAEHKRATIEQWFVAALAQKPSQKQSRSAFHLHSSWQANMSERQYHKKFNQVQKFLLSGDCYQINLAQRFSAHYQGDEFEAYLALRAANQAPFSAFMRLADSCILSISPERFIQLKQDKVQSKPIKGTAPRHQDLWLDQQRAQTLQQSIKNRAENLMIVDLLRNDLSKVCEAGSVTVEQLFAIESFPAVHHLVSTITGKLAPPHQATDLLRGAFPGGSITGAPKIRAMQIIEQLEPDRRNLYCGSIGYIAANGDMDTNIAIRTLVCYQGQIFAWAGGGLVADSTADEEYQETYDKVNKILPILDAL